LEDSADSRVIIKADKAPDTYGDAKRINGTSGTYIYQYSDKSSADEAIEYYSTLDNIKWLKKMALLNPSPCHTEMSFFHKFW